MPLQLLGRRHELLRVAALESWNQFQQSTQPLLAVGQVVGDGVRVLRHNHIYVLDGAPVGESSNILLATFSWRVRSACGAAPWSRRCR